jgi:hypothetical protein
MVKIVVSGDHKKSPNWGTGVVFLIFGLLTFALTVSRFSKLKNHKPGKWE